MHKKYIVTGANGFIGSRLVHKLVEQNKSVIALVGPDMDIQSIQHLPVEIRPFDLLKPRKMSQVLEGGHYLFHTAACYSFWRQDMEELYRINVMGTQYLLQAAKQIGIERTVYTSSTTTLTPYIPSIQSIDQTEEEQLFDIREFHGHYKSSKVMAEVCVLRAAAQGLPITIVHPTAPIGVGDRRPTPTGEMIVHFINRRMRAYIDMQLNLVDVDDVVDGHILALEKGQNGESYILGGDNISMQQFLKLLSELTGIGTPLFKIPISILYRMGQISEAISNRITKRAPLIPVEAALHARTPIDFTSNKARQQLGYSPKPLHLAVIKAIQWFLENGYGPKKNKISFDRV